MKAMKISVYLRPVFWTSVVLLLAAVLSGCALSTGSAGETHAEVQRRHKRIYESSHLQLQDDIDAWLLMDRPSRLSDKVIR